MYFKTVDENALDTCKSLSIVREPDTGNCRSKRQCIGVEVHQRFEPGGTLTSDNVDYRLMLYILSSLGNIEVGVSYPYQSDTRIEATLYRIKYIRNEIIQIFDGILSDDIEQVQVISKLIASHVLEIENDQEERRPIDGLDNACIHFLIDLDLHKRNRQFTDISPEENNFLVVIHGLTTIVYPVIQNRIKIHCTEDLLNKILREKDPKQLDLKMIIDILKRNTDEEGKKEYIDQLDVIDNIRQEIVQSSSWFLNVTRFKDILESIRKNKVRIRQYNISK